MDDQQRADGGKPLAIAVLANDTAAKGAGADPYPLTDTLGADGYRLEVFKTPAHGTAVAAGDLVTYTPTAGYSGPDEFVYRLAPTDSAIEGGTAVVRITVAAPAPSQKPTPTATPTKAPRVYYRNCAAARAAGVAPLHRGDRGYGAHLDRDGDGTACEPYSGSASGGSSSRGSGGGGGGAYYANCAAARAAGAAPVRRGDPGYGRHLDRDGDGVACE
ncbi:excalibur calcium-binding domain-containing protein [Streptomyces sp. NPDC048604]|uniref:excalibur calcium-binding domain-containing protein n=1 Tax=Streptomyces sp. NPDC048604 TaxID=3365578 RepID=UPI0037226C86